MQMQQQVHCKQHTVRQHRLAFRQVRPARVMQRNSVANGNGIALPSCPSPAETARTIADLCQEGTLCTLSADGHPLAAPISYKLDDQGNPVLQVVSGSQEAINIARGSSCSLLVQPVSYPARGVASVALQVMLLKQAAAITTPTYDTNLAVNHPIQMLLVYKQCIPISTGRNPF